MASLNDIHEAIAEVVGGVDGIRGFSYPPQGASPPLAWPELDDWEPSAMGRAGWKEYRFDLYVCTALGARPQDGYKSLVEYADSSSTKSIELALWDAVDQPAGTFNDVANVKLSVAGFRKIGRIDVDGVEMYGGVFTLNVATKGA
jgi:hypothetical protein